MKRLKSTIINIKSKLKSAGERGAGTVAETLLITLFAVLITGGVATLIYNAVSDKGNEVTSIIRSTGNANAQDLDGDGYPNGLVLVGVSQDGATQYWRQANPTLDYGIPGASLDGNDDGDAACNGETGNTGGIDVTTNITGCTAAVGSADTINLVSTNAQDNYFKNLGASVKSTVEDPHNANKF